MAEDQINPEPIAIAADDPDNTEDVSQGYGDWNEELPDDLQRILKDLAADICDEFRYPRRLEVMRAWQARSFWRELQHLNWNWEGQCWDVLGPAGGDRPGDPNQANSAVLYTTNIYQGFGDAFIAIITQAVPTVRFEPEDPEEPVDIESARAAEPARKILQHQNDPIRLMTKAAYYAWTDGRMHAWTRWATDKRTGKPRVVQTLFGVMEVKVPVIFEEDCEYDYVQLSTEYPLSQIREKVAKRNFPPDSNSPYWKKIQGGSSGNGQDIYERTARISVKQGISMKSAGGDAYSKLVTTQRTWMDPSRFYSDRVPDEKRDTLIGLFPDGAYVEFDNSTYTGSRNCSLHDEWAVENVMEGDGSSRQAKGSCLVSVQERANDVINVTQDVYEKTQPASHWDDKMFDLNGMRRQVSIPGARYGINQDTLPPGDLIANHVFFEPAASVSQDMLVYTKTLITDIPEFLTGVSSILFGADKGTDKSGKALSIQQAAAMGRVGLSFRVMKRLYAKMMEQAVRCLARNNGTDVSIGIPDAQGAVEKISVRIEDLLGRVLCYPEVDENIPESWLAQKQTFMSLMQEGQADPATQQMLAHPRNQELKMKLIGLSELESDAKIAWEKQMAEIRIMTQTSPVPQPPKLGLVPDALGQPQPQIQPQPPKSSVPIDVESDFHPLEFTTCQWWLNNPEGQKTKKMNPIGWANVKLHMLEHKQVIDAQAAAQLKQQIAIQAITHAKPPSPNKGSAPKQKPREANAPLGGTS